VTLDREDLEGTTETPTGQAYETRVGDVAGAVHTGRGDIFHIEKVELAATRTADALRRALSHDEDARAQLLEVLRELSSLQAQLSEWKELHHILHEILTAFSPFYADLRALGNVQTTPHNGRMLLRGWRPCQGEVDRLIDFESRVEHIGPFLHPQGSAVSPAQTNWGARIALLRREVEDRLREAQWSVEGLLDLSDEFSYACDCYLGLADRELRRIVEKLQRLYTHLLGGLL
jgi:hypothetical protein